MLISGFKRKAISLLLAVIFILQSCSVYKREPSNFDAAIEKKVHVKATKSNGETYFISKIEKVDGVYYGDVVSDNGIERLIISDNDFRKIQQYDLENSIGLTFLGLLITSGLIFGAWAAWIVNSGGWNSYYN